MSKLVKNTLVSNFLTQYGEFNTLVVETALGIFLAIVDGIKVGYFEKNITDTVDEKGRDKALKKTFTDSLDLFYKEQAETCKGEILSLPDDVWSDDSPSKANVEVFEITQNADGSVIIMKSGSTMKRVRAVIQYVAQQHGRLAVWDMLHLDGDALKDQYNEYRTDMNQYNADLQKAGAGDSGSDNPTPDNDGGGETISIANMDQGIAESLKGLQKSLASVPALTPEQVVAITNMIDSITDHVRSLGEVEGSDAPKVEVKPQAAKKAATG